MIRIHLISRIVMPVQCEKENPCVVWPAWCNPGRRFLNPELIQRMRSYFKPAAVQPWHRKVLEKALDFPRIPGLVGARR